MKLIAIKNKSGEICLKPNLPSYIPMHDADEDDIYDAVARFRHEDEGKIADFEINEGIEIDEDKVKCVWQYKHPFDTKWKTEPLHEPHFNRDIEHSISVHEGNDTRLAYIINTDKSYTHAEVVAIVEKYRDALLAGLPGSTHREQQKYKYKVGQHILDTPFSDLI